MSSDLGRTVLNNGKTHKYVTASVFSPNIHSVSNRVHIGLSPLTRIEMEITREPWKHLRCFYYQDTCVWKVQPPVHRYSCHNYPRMTNEHLEHIWERVIEIIRQGVKKKEKNPSVNPPPQSSHISIIKERKDFGTHANLIGAEWPCKAKMRDRGHESQQKQLGSTIRKDALNRGANTHPQVPQFTLRPNHTHWAW